MPRGQTPAYRRLREETARLAFKFDTAPQILDALVADADRLGLGPSKFPDERTVARWLNEIRSSDTSPLWVPIASVDPRQPARVLPVLAEVVSSFGEKRWLSHDLADLVDRVVLAAPGVPPLWAFGLAHGYRWAREKKRGTRGLDLTLALKPWLSMEGATAWANLMRDIGDEAGGWPGGGPGIMALAARLPPPDWTMAPGGEPGMWGSLLWEILTRGITAVFPVLDGSDAEEFEPMDQAAPAEADAIDSKLTAKPIDGSGQTETVEG